MIGNNAISQIFRVMEEQSQATFDADWNVVSYYNWTGTPGALSPAVNNEGNGEPKGYTVSNEAFIRFSTGKRCCLGTRGHTP